MEARGRDKGNKGDAGWRERRQIDERHGYTLAAQHRELRRCDEQTPQWHQAGIKRG
jgi:hypothetical protein